MTGASGLENVEVDIPFERAVKHVFKLHLMSHAFLENMCSPDTRRDQSDLDTKLSDQINNTFFFEKIYNHEYLMLAIRANDLAYVDIFLRGKGVDPSASDNEAIRVACDLGYIKIVRRLLKEPSVDPGACNNEALTSAIFWDYKDIVTILVNDPRVDPTKPDDLPIRVAKTMKRETIQRVLESIKNPRVVKRSVSF